MKTVVHVTHEAVQKIGGIGAVLHGLLTSKTYSAGVKRDILLGPLFSTEGRAEDRLHGGEVLYSGIDHINKTPYGHDLQRIEHTYGVGIVYGRKTFFDPLTGVTSNPEVLLIDVRHYHPDKMGVFKFILFEDYGIRSQDYEHIWDYEQYCRIAEPGLEAVHALGACSNGDTPIVVSHEYMGMPTALIARSKYPGQFRTIFYAHEVATMRRIVEHNPGHDTMFYNAMNKAMAEGKYVEDVFGSQADFYKHPLVAATKYCDNIFAVGDYTAKELKFMGKDFEKVHIGLAYNGVPARKLTLKEKMTSRDRLRKYAENLLGFLPDYVFTHVTRMVPSKGLWRDIKVMAEMEKLMAAKGETAVLFVLSTEMQARPEHDVRNMEKHYKWPAAHREGWPDLSGGEASYYAGVQEWNARSRNCKVVYINQFGFERARCGHRMAEEMEFLDIRKGSDAEFGQSIYEPFGIAQVEPISFGGICVFTELCGCSGFVKKAAGGKPTALAIDVDYTQLPAKWKDASLKELLKIDGTVREHVETTVAAHVAKELHGRLPKSTADFEKLVMMGGELGANMSWEVVARDFVLPGFEHALKQPAPRKKR